MKSAFAFPLAVSLCAVPALAEPLGPQLQDATIVGRGSTITIRRMPVRTPNGTVYRNITIELNVDAEGAVRADAKNRGVKAAATSAPTTAVVAHDVSVGQVTETAAAPEVAAPFLAGLYRDDSHGGLVRITNEGNRVFEGFPTWSLSAVSGDTVMSAAEWYGGPLRTNPHRRMVERAAITAENYSFGVVDSSGPGHFDQGMLIGAVQTGPKLTLVSFHRRGCCTYSATPTSTISYTRIGR